MTSARDPQLSNPDAARLLERAGSFNFGTVSNWINYYDIKIGLKKELTKMYFYILFIIDFVQQVTSHKKLFVFAPPGEHNSLGITSTILFSCLTGDAFQMILDSMFRVGSHQHLALVVHHHPTIISQWLPKSNTQHGQMD